MNTGTTNDRAIAREDLASTVHDALAAQPVWDLHTHLYPSSFGTPVANASGKTDPRGLMLWGIDELITYHYLIAEVYRIVPPGVLPYEQYWKMTRRQQADHIWKHLFIERSPISEACRGILTTIKLLGFDANDGLDTIRKHIEQQDPDRYVDRVMKLANVERITMTNAVFDDNERERWLANKNVGSDPRFAAVLRIDPMLRDWPTAARKLSEWGYQASVELDQKTIDESRRFLRDWLDRMNAIYIAVSLPPEFRYPAEAGDVERAGQKVLEQVVLPVCAERKLPFAIMIGSRLRVNPDLREAGDMCGKADIDSLVRICRSFPQNKFLVTMLARENQHELAVAARKFGNLMLFGCWWFVNNPSLIEEITRMRMELLGTSFIPQHSDARILDQLIYKWDHSRRIIGKVLADKYGDLLQTGWKLTKSQVQRDARFFLRDSFVEFLNR
jgi:hypothetical protein